MIKVEDVVILHEHEIVSDFRFKSDIHAVLKNHNAYTNLKNIRSAIDELYSNKYLTCLQNEFPDKETLINSLENQKDLHWAKALNIFIEQKAIKGMANNWIVASHRCSNGGI